ncbi:hypothetical protein [Urbifossiella limnaea]|uniref:DUF2142 domain-containing protein n=1 Tax=Urbifossiella limnaea TaxID=2528023 RepID=A0A517XTQ0_9BACT|nr:hypothetical protein [Urbifossiella limnaea]QDU20885.1 hypothetical protein ETAA1_28480 [Urbifossiella limnaea]
MTTDLPPRTDRLWIALVAFSLFLFGWTIREGQSAGLHRVMPEAIERHESCVSVAVSDLRYGLKGYTAYRAVRAELQTNGWTWNTDILKQTGLSYPENMTARDRLDYGLARATSLSHPEKDGVDHLPVFAEDVGYADFVKLGFVLFGYKLGALYGAYFVVLGASLALYLFAYRRDVPMLLLIVAFQITLFLLVRALPQIGAYDVSPQTRFQLATVTNGRFLGTLGLVPFFHLAGCLLTWPRATAGRVAVAAVQAGLLGLALHFRGSAMWMFATLFVLAATPAALWLWRNRRGMLTHPVTAAAAGKLAAARWPAVLVVIGLVAQKAYVSSATHWTYHGDDGLPNHLFWHNALIALEFHPEWKQQAIYPGKGNNDSTAWETVAKRLDDEGIGHKYAVSPLTGAYKARLHDRLCKQIYLEFARSHPKYMLELFLVHKPKLLAKFVADDWKWIRPGTRRPDAIGMLAAFAGCLLLAARRPTADSWGVPAVVALAGFGGSMLPLFWAYPFFHVLGEALMLAGLCGVVLGVAAVVGLTRIKVPTRWRVRLPGAAGRVNS